MRHLSLAVLLFSAAMASARVDAGQIQIKVTTPFVFIQIGHGFLSTRGLLGQPANLIDEVSFAFPAGVQLADGTPIVGTPVIPMAVIGLNPGRRVDFVVTMNSAAPLSNANGDSLPFSEFSWTSSDGSIPAGRFDDSANQFLVNYTRRRANRGRGLVDRLTFSYDNDVLYPAGTYTGRVVYTITSL